MSKIISIKLTLSGSTTGPFKVLDDTGKVLSESVLLSKLISGISFTVEDSVQAITIVSLDKCNITKSFSVIDSLSNEDYANSTYKSSKAACLWTHLKNTVVYNYFYGSIDPYIIEYPFAYKYEDEIVQNVKDYSKVYKYFPNSQEGFDTNKKVQVDNLWFNKAVLYNTQQSSGVLNLVAKPVNDLSKYLQYPIFNEDSKTITFTKSDNFYQYNNFWALQKNDQIPLFTTPCESLSLDKEVNQENMDYNRRSFNKSPLRGKNLKVRHILDNSSTTHIVSQFIVTPAQISYK